MKPLVYYCRWQGAKLRLRGRNDSAVWGEFVFENDGRVQKSEEFYFNLITSELIVQQVDGELSIVLDEMGVPLLLS